MQNSVAVFDKLEAETGQTIDWRKSGSLRVASSDVRMTEIRRSLTQAQGFGFEAYEITAQEAQDKFPGCRSTASSAPPGFHPTATLIPTR